MLVAQYVYHAAWNALFGLVGPLLHRGGEAAKAVTAAAQDSSVKAGGLSSLVRSTSRRQLASI